jgi:branched-chain amino acid aminotransferase
MEWIVKEKKDLKPIFEDENQIGFGKYYTDYMLIMSYSKEKGWYNAEITEFKDISISPAALVFHYGQEIFEGMKGFLGKDGKIRLFRPMENMNRLNRSADRLMMPEFDGKFVLQGLKKLLILDKRWFPKNKGNAVYIRPTMIAVEPTVYLKPADEYLFYIILSPAAGIYGLKELKLYAETEFVRAAIGGTADIKTGGNYASAFYPGRLRKGFDALLWLDSQERKYVQEVGTMNIFFVEEGNSLITPKLDGGILPGMTRDSIIKIAQHNGYKVEERRITIDEVVDKISKGVFTEAFGTGTAAIVSPIREIFYKDRLYRFSFESDLRNYFYNTLLNIQYGIEEDLFNWVEVIE